MSNIINLLFGGIGLVLLGLLVKTYILSPREKPCIEVKASNDLRVGTSVKVIGLSARNTPYDGKLTAFVKRHAANDIFVTITVANENNIPFILAKFKGLWDGPNGSTQVDLVPGRGYRYLLIAQKNQNQINGGCEFIGQEVGTSQKRTWNVKPGQYRVRWELCSSGQQILQGQLILNNPSTNLDEFLLQEVDT